jgi:hypothetical protein
MSELPTIKVKSDTGFKFINEADFDPSQHVLFDEKPPATEADDVTLDFTSDGNKPLGYDSGDQFSDAELRDAIKEATGQAPGPRTARETLIERFNELNKDAANGA